MSAPGPGRIIALALLALLPACAGDGTSELEPLTDLAEVDAPAGPGSSWPFLFSTAEGPIYLTWLEPEDPGASGLASTRPGAFHLRFSARENGQWSEARTIAGGDHFFVNWADFPSLIELPDGALAAHWLAYRPDAPPEEDYGFYLAFSRDGGESWTEPLTAGPAGEPRGLMPTLFSGNGAEGVTAVWLERPRETRGIAGAGESGDDGDGELLDQMTLRYGAFHPETGSQETTLLDGQVCSCCQIGVASTDQGPVVVYRDRSPDEVRDISVVRLTDEGWSEPLPLHHDGWVIPACPVNGPAVSAREREVAVAWFTGAQDAPRVYLSFSHDSGATFGDAVRVDEGDPLGRVDVELLPDGTAVVSWLERASERAEIRIRRLTPGGAAGPARTLAVSTGERVSGFPRMLRRGQDLFFAWTHPGEPDRIRVARARVPPAWTGTGM